MVDYEINGGIWALIALAVLSAWEAGTVWLAQVSGYPLWPLVGRAELPRYLSLWTGAVRGLVLAPAVLMVAAGVVAVVVPARGSAWWQGWVWLAMAVAVAVMVWFGGAAGRVAGAGGGLDLALFGSFLQRQWIGVALTTVLFLWTWGGVAVRIGERGSWVLAGTAGFACVGLAQVWMVQTLCYRLWPVVGRGDFYDYHVAWWHSIWTSIFIPAGVALTGTVVLIWQRPVAMDARLVAVLVGLQALLYLGTAAWWGPLMGRLATRSEGLLADRYALLMSTHWARVAVVTASAVVAVWGVVLVGKLVAGSR
jgi:hypothetical protein